MSTLFLRSSEPGATDQLITLPPNVKTIANLKAMLSITHFDLMVEPEEISLLLEDPLGHPDVLHDLQPLEMLPSGTSLIYSLPAHIDPSSFMGLQGASQLNVSKPFNQRQHTTKQANNGSYDDEEDDIIDLDTGMAELSSIATPNIFEKAGMQTLGLSSVVTDITPYHSSLRVAKETIDYISKKYVAISDNLTQRITEKATVLVLLECGIEMVNAMMSTGEEECLESVATLVKALENVCRGLPTSGDTISILAQVLGSHANLLKIKKNYLESVRQYQACYQLQSAVGDIRGSVLTLLNAVGALMQCGEKARALTLVSQARDTLETQLSEDGVSMGTVLPEDIGMEVKREDAVLPLSSLPLAATLSMTLRVGALVCIANKQIGIARDYIQRAVAVAETVLQCYPEDPEDSELAKIPSSGRSTHLGISEYSELSNVSDYEEELALCLLEYAKMMMADRNAADAANFACRAAFYFERNKRKFDEEHSKITEKASSGSSSSSTVVPNNTDTNRKMAAPSTPQGFIQSFKPHLTNPTATANSSSSISSSSSTSTSASTTSTSASTSTSTSASASSSTSTSTSTSASASTTTVSPPPRYAHTAALFHALNLAGSGHAMVGSFAIASDFWTLSIPIGEEAGVSVEGAKANARVCEAKLRRN